MDKSSAPDISDTIAGLKARDADLAQQIAGWKADRGGVALKFAQGDADAGKALAKGDRDHDAAVREREAIAAALVEAERQQRHGGKIERIAIAERAAADYPAKLAAYRKALATFDAKFAELLPAYRAVIDAEGTTNEAFSDAVRAPALQPGDLSSFNGSRFNIGPAILAQLARGPEHANPAALADYLDDRVELHQQMMGAAIERARHELLHADDRGEDNDAALAAQAWPRGQTRTAGGTWADAYQSPEPPKAA